jgi:predicted ATPase
MFHAALGGGGGRIHENSMILSIPNNTSRSTRSSFSSLGNASIESSTLFSTISAVAAAGAPMRGINPATSSAVLCGHANTSASAGGATAGGVGPQHLLSHHLRRCGSTSGRGHGGTCGVTDEKVSSSIQTLLNVSQRLAPSINTRMTQQGFTLNQLKFSEMKLYGRDDEIEVLDEALEQTVKQAAALQVNKNRIDVNSNQTTTRNSRTEIVMISGYAGTGKSSLARELETPCRKKYAGCFGYGKCEHSKSMPRHSNSSGANNNNNNPPPPMPYSVISAAFTNLVQDILLQTTTTTTTTNNSASQAAGTAAVAEGPRIIETNKATNNNDNDNNNNNTVTDSRLKELQLQLTALLGGPQPEAMGHHVLQSIIPNLQQLLLFATTAAENGEDGMNNKTKISPSYEQPPQPPQQQQQEEEVSSTTVTSATTSHVEGGEDARMMMRASIQTTASEDVTNVAGHARSSDKDKFKLQLLLRKVTAAICQIFSPVVLVLDDLQHVDAASLDLLYALATDGDIFGLLIVGCYRDNEVRGSHHTLRQFLNQLAAGGPPQTSKEHEPPAAAAAAVGDVRLTTISVGNLDIGSIQSMLEDLLEMKNPADAERFARVLYTKTFGNIFFVIQFLETLQQMELLTFNVGQFEWQWDNDAIERNMIATDNVAELTTLEIENLLSRPAQNALQIAACLGSWFLESTLVVLITRMSQETEGGEEGQQHVFTWESGTAGHRHVFMWESGTAADEDEVKNLLNECVQGGFLHRRVCTTAVDEDEVISYHFVHDVIQEAAISLIVHQDFAQFHIGKVLIENLPTDEQESNLFVIVDPMNHGMKVHSLKQSRSLLIGLNLRAGKKALQSSAFEAATEYLSFCVSLLGCDCWNDENYKLSLDIFSTAAQAEFCNANLEKCKIYIDRVLAQKQRPMQDKLPVYTCLYSIYNFQEKHAEALSTCLMVFKKLGINFGPTRLLPVTTLRTMMKMKRLMRDMDANDLLNLPPMTDEGRIMAMRLLDRALVSLKNIIKANSFCSHFSLTRN